MLTWSSPSRPQRRPNASGAQAPPPTTAFDGTYAGVSGVSTRSQPGSRNRYCRQPDVPSPPLTMPDSPLERDGFELVWGFPCQVVFFGLLPVLCSEREVAVLHPVAHDQVPGARSKASRDGNASKAWRLAA